MISVEDVGGGKYVEVAEAFLPLIVKYKVWYSILAPVSMTKRSHMTPRAGATFFFNSSRQCRRHVTHPNTISTSPCQAVPPSEQS